MLSRLTISNFALIDNLNLSFKNGYSVITGETGAGKSIILKALNLLLGDRADYSVIKVKQEKCIIEAEFNIRSLNLEKAFNNWDVDYDENTIIRREFTPSGKSRLFINDTPTTLNTLKSLGGKLIKIHAQHETLDLFDRQFQMDALDSLAEHTTLVKAYAKAYANYKHLIKTLNDLEEKASEQKKAKGYTQFLIEEFEKANFKNIDVDALIKEADQLDNWEHIQLQLSTSLDVLANDSMGPAQSLRIGIDALQKISHLSKKYQSLLERFQSVKIEIEDVESELSDIVSSAEIDEERAQIVQSQIQDINSLLHKHNASNGAELTQILSGLETELTSFANLENDIDQLKQDIHKQKNELVELASEMTTNRTSTLPRFEKSVNKVLHELGMSNAELKLELSRSEDLTKNGYDTVQFLFKTNLGGHFLPISKTASGGELSRLMLSILHITAGVQHLPVLFFDEIDTGLSGEVASKMANLFAKMGQHTQLISISHLPQIAGKASTHYHVYKTVDSNTTITKVKELDNQERINELAKMMSGESVTKNAIENAKQLLELV